MLVLNNGVRFANVRSALVRQVAAATGRTGQHFKTAHETYGLQTIP